MDMETIPEKEATVVKQLESEGKCLGFRVAKGKDQILATSCHTSVPEKLIDTQCDGKGRRFLPKVHPALFRILVSYHCNSIALLSSSVLKKCWHSKRLVHFLGTLFMYLIWSMFFSP